MKRYAGFLALLIILLITACSNSGNGEFLSTNMYTDSLEENKKHFIVSTLEWTGSESVTINSIELIKEGGKPVLFNEDGISYKFYGADALKQEGFYTREDIGDTKDINGHQIKGEGRIVMEFTLDGVSEDPNRKMKVNYTVNGVTKEQIIVSDTFKRLSSNN